MSAGPNGPGQCLLGGTVGETNPLPVCLLALITAFLPFSPSCPLMAFAHLYIRAFFENAFSFILNVVKMPVCNEVVLNE